MSNDYQYHKQFIEQGTKIIILDHHEAEMISPYAIVINNQLSDYPNKQLSGVGIVWQFCRYLDELLNKDYANKYLDLVALGLTADMMSLASFETKHLITKGFRDENIHNPFILGMADKNAYSLGGKITSMGAAFYIAPLVNAVLRSGTQEEKEIVFKSMINHWAEKLILSTKRGHKPGEQEALVTQALRVATNVKNRQTKIEDATLTKLEQYIKDRNLLEHKVLLFLLEPGEVDKNVAGLCANKLMAKYQRPCCVLTKTTDLVQDGYVEELDNYENKVSYQGSARGCEMAGAGNFKDTCEGTGVIDYCAGHQGAFGLGLPAALVDDFIIETDKVLKDISNEPIYYVDYIYNNNDIKAQDILDIAMLDELWGKDMPEPYIAIKGLRIKKEMVTVYSKKDLTLKITLPNKLSLIMFKASEELCNKLQNENPGYYIFDIIGRCSKNEWNSMITPQIKITDYEEVSKCAYDF